MKKYNKPILEVENIEMIDVITASTGTSVFDFSGFTSADSHIEDLDLFGLNK